MTTEAYDQAMEARSKGDLQNARQLLMAHLQSSEGDERARSALGAVSIELGEPAEAVRVLHPLVTKYPTNPALLVRYGVALRDAGRLTDAIKVLSHASEIEKTAENQRELDLAINLDAKRRETTILRPEPAARNSLAVSLDDDSTPQHQTSEQVRGELQESWRRRISSYRRFWLGLLICFAGAMRLLIVKIQGKSSPTGSDVSDFLHNIYLVPLLIFTGGLLLLGSSFLSSRFTRYKVYEHRIDFERGVISQARKPVWLFDITSVSVKRPPMLTMTHTAAIIVEHDTKAGKPSREKIVATCRVSQMSDFAERLQGIALRERRAMKKMWI